MQAFEALYRWDASFPLGHALAKLSSGTVRVKLRTYARLHGLYARATFRSTVLTVHFDTQTDRSASVPASSVCTCALVQCQMTCEVLHFICAGTWQL